MDNPYQPPNTIPSADVGPSYQLFSIRAKLSPLCDAERTHLLRSLVKSTLVAYAFLVFGIAITTATMLVLASRWWMIVSASAFVFWVAAIKMFNNNLKAHRIQSLQCNDGNHEVVFDGYSDRFRLQSEHSEQYGSWLVLTETMRDADKLILLAPTLLDPVAVCLDGVDNIDDRTRQISMGGIRSAKTSYKDLFPEQIFTHIQWSEPMSMFRGSTTAQQMRELDPVAWGIQRWQISLSTFFVVAVLLTAIASYGTIAENIGGSAIRWDDYFFIVASSALAVVAAKQFPLLMRAWRLLLSDRAKGSDIVQFLSSEGAEVRSNGGHFRFRWALFSDAELLSDRIVATNQCTGRRVSVLSKSQFLTPEDWGLASQIALNSIPSRPSTPFREFGRQSTI